MTTGTSTRILEITSQNYSNHQDTRTAGALFMAGPEIMNDRGTGNGMIDRGLMNENEAMARSDLRNVVFRAARGGGGG
jgi:hypothetical protein